MDCGLFQGRRAEAWEQNSGFPFDPVSIDVLVLSHAHIDHSGKIPMLYRHGFRGPIICTAATRDLANIMLLDSAFLQEKDAEFVNKLHKRNGKPPVEAAVRRRGRHRRARAIPDRRLSAQDARDRRCGRHLLRRRAHSRLGRESLRHPRW
jgi:metal-dependent hydrolase (beta-lactamase superfamily II)